MSTDPIVRPAGPDDLAAVAGIYAHYVTGTVATFDETPPAVADWRQRLDHLSGLGLPFLVAKVGEEGRVGEEATVGGEVVGYAYASPWRPKPAYRHTVEDSVYLAPAWTGRGLGTALLQALLDGCGRAGARQVVAVIADTGTDASAALHRRLGFEHAGRLTGVGYKHGRWVDTILMQRAIPQRLS
jgi:L-amino acid N-acyltransferase YncA